MRTLHIHPPLLNSANPWCSSLEQLQELYDTPHTGAVTTRTSLLHGFPHDDSVHQFTFYNPLTGEALPPNPSSTLAKASETGSLNTLGYSPIPLEEYLGFIKTISDALPHSASASRGKLKPFIISVTGTADEVVECYRMICSHQRSVSMTLAMEVNLSCPNIPSKPPPAYDAASLLSYLVALKREVAHQIERDVPPIGIKTPPYTYQGQFQQLISALLDSAKAEPTHLPCPISFITATNTLGSSLLLSPMLETISSHVNQSTSADATQIREVFHHTLNSASGTGIGGLAGTPLHPLALGNVYTIKGMLFQHSELDKIQIIGIGGVENGAGYLRMRAVGAAAVGVGTALGRKGISVFQEIMNEAQTESSGRTV